MATQKKDPQPVPMRHVVTGMLLGGSATIFLFYKAGVLEPGQLAVAIIALPFVLYYLWSNRAPGGMFVEKKAAPLSVWARRAVVLLLVLDLGGTVTKNPDHNIYRVVAVALLVPLLAMTLWTRRRRQLESAHDRQ